MTQPPSLPKLFGAAFAEHPEAAYQLLRESGPVAWAEIADGVYALVVTSHRAAIDLLTNTEVFSKDSRRWAALNTGQVPPDSPVLAMMAYRPSLLYSDGSDHARLRQAMDDCMARIDIHQLQETTRLHAAGLIARIAPAGHAELMRDYADTLPLLVFVDILGCPTELVSRLVTAYQGVIGADTDAMQAAADAAGCLAELIGMKRAAPGRDFTSWMIAHQARMSDEEILHQLFCFVGAGVIPTAAWIASSLRLLQDDQTYARALTGGTVTVRAAMEQVLWTRPPMANFSAHFARHDTNLHGVPVPGGVPILISHAATGADPALPDLGYGNRSHLAWSTGPHRCPADSQAAVIAQTGIETVLDQLWELDLAAPGANRHGPFHQCPAALPATFRAQPATASPGGSV